MKPDQATARSNRNLADAKPIEPAAPMDKALVPIDENQNPDDLSTYEMLRRLESGLLDPKKISHDTRQAIVQEMVGEGWTAGDLAHAFAVSVRTIQRDIKEIRHRMALTPQPGLGHQLMGEFERIVLRSAQRLARMSASHDGRIGERVFAEQTLGQQIHMFIQAAAKFGYIGDVKAEMKAIQELDPNIPKQLQLKGEITRASMPVYGPDDETVNKLTAQLKKYFDQEYGEK